MSHFSLYVLVSQGTKNIDAAVGHALAPYDEELAVDGYEVDCYCIGATARRAGNDAANAARNIDALRTEYWAKPEHERPEWEDWIRPWREVADAVEREHALCGRPDPDCEDCMGSGTRTTTSNPNGRWDWYQIGGRWTGALSEGAYDPELAPENITSCSLCGGSGVRVDDPRRLVEQAIALGRDLGADRAVPPRLIHTDLHYGNVLAHASSDTGRERWLAIDPKPVNGDPHYEIAPMLWNRFEELAGDVRDGVRRRFWTLVDAAGFDEDRARAWVVVRMVHNAMWAVQDGPQAEPAWLTTCIALAKAVQD